jgi:hypothetical protein
MKSLTECEHDTIEGVGWREGRLIGVCHGCEHEFIATEISTSDWQDCNCVTVMDWELDRA